MAMPPEYTGPVITDRSAQNPTFYTPQGRRLLSVGGKYYDWGEGVKFAYSPEALQMYAGTEVSNPWIDAASSQGRNPSR
jgi:hypothetical protein